MIDITPIIPARFINEIRRDLGTSAVLALKRTDKIATARTAQSVRTDGERVKTGLEFNLYASEGIEYIIKGKPPNTKLPVRKVGNKFELFPRIKDWKAVRNFQGSDFVLARAIAKNRQEPVDIPGLTLKIFEEMYGDKISSELLTFYAQALGKGIVKLSK